MGKIKYPTIPKSLELQIKHLFSNCDLGKLSGILKECKMTKSLFLDLAYIAIDNDSLNSLKWLLDAYYQFWTTEVFNAIINYMLVSERFTFCSFIDAYIDKVNRMYYEERNNGGD